MPLLACKKIVLQQGFNEQQGVVLVANSVVDVGTDTAGTRVDSHLIFLNSKGSSRIDTNASWTFDGLIVGVMSDAPGLLMSATALLGFVGLRRRAKTT